MQLTDLITNTKLLAPEVILALAVCVVLIADMFSSLAASRKVCGALAIAGALAAMFAVGAAPGEASAFGTLTLDSLGGVFKMIFLGGTALCLVFAMNSRELDGYRFGEFAGLMLGAAMGACLLVSANNMAMFVLGLETLSLCSYPLAGFVKHERAPAEAALKYVLYGAVASGVMLFGLGYLYGFGGSLDLTVSMTNLVESGRIGDGAVLLALLLVMAGLGFKIAMVPFHFWCPDVYQGAPTPVTAFLSVVSKAAGFGAILRLFGPAVEAAPAALCILTGVAAMLTMTYGNLTAIRQTDVKRLLAYSSIAHAGYLLMGLAVMNVEAVQAVVMYLIVYALMNLGAFWVVTLLVNRTGSAELVGFRGVATKSWGLAAAMFVFLISLTGLPPTAGFVAKLNLFKAVVDAGLTDAGGDFFSGMSLFYFILAIVGVLNSAVSLYYYMKIVKAMAFDKADEATPGFAPAWGELALAGAMAIMLVALLDFDPLIHAVSGVATMAGVR